MILVEINALEIGVKMVPEAVFREKCSSLLLGICISCNAECGEWEVKAFG